jgi:hypothetical protein
MTDRATRTQAAFEAGRFWAIRATWLELEEFVLGPHDATFPEAYTVEERHAFHRGAKSIYDKVNERKSPT